MNSEFTGERPNEEYIEWYKSLTEKTPIDASKAIYNRILEVGNLDDESKQIFSEAFDYAIKLIEQDKPLEPNLLKIYFQDIKGRDTNQIDIVSLLTLLSICGLEFSNSN